MMKKSKILIYMILILFVFLVTWRIYDLAVNKKDYYINEYKNLTEKQVLGPSAPRGRILDVNGKVLVDNIGVNAVVYNRSNVSDKIDEVELSYKLGTVLKFESEKFTNNRLKTFYLKINNNGDDLISNEEKNMYEERKLNKDDINALKYERITDEMLLSMSEEDKNASYIYFLLTNGYAYENKFIKTGLSDEEAVLINDMKLPGIKINLTWERTYPYGEVLRSLFGTISQTVPRELKEHFEKEEISLNSTVGISSLEYQYDSYLRGRDAVFKVNMSGGLELVSKEETGNDLYLSIDIDKQLEIENILKAEMLNAKKAKNTDFYNHSYVIISHPKTGEIVSAVGLQLVDEHFVDITGNMVNSSYTVGSIVKGATISVGYEQGLIEEGKKVQDGCVKVYGVQKKCSWKSLGMIDDVRALAMSSNYYQFMIAARLANPNYKWNAHLNVTKEHFDIYRNMLSSYGLGTITGIDLPNERVGIIGKTVSDDLILNLAIGQYDTYTPIEVAQYVNTIANDGVKLKPTLMKKIIKDNQIVVENKPSELGKVNLSSEKIKRVQQGLKAVIDSGTGSSYSTKSVSAAGKTGTSETFVDTNGDGKMDTQTISSSFIMYAPFDNPEYSIVIISPNLSKKSKNSTTYKYSLNLRVNREIMKVLFGS